jgi:hypothetical protein
MLRLVAPHLPFCGSRNLIRMARQCSDERRFFLCSTLRYYFVCAFSDSPRFVLLKIRYQRSCYPDPATVEPLALLCFRGDRNNTRVMIDRAHESESQGSAESRRGLVCFRAFSVSKTEGIPQMPGWTYFICSSKVSGYKPAREDPARVQNRIGDTCPLKVHQSYMSPGSDYIC